MLPYILVVVDVETRFKSAYGAATLRNICREVKTAMELGCKVLLLTTPQQGVQSVIEPQVSDLLESYSHSVEIRQKLDFQGNSLSDGTDQVLLTCAQRKWQTERYRLVGVRTDCCVLKTALGLSERRPNHKVEVVQDACETDYDEDCWDQFAEPNIVLLPGADALGKTVPTGSTNR